MSVVTRRILLSVIGGTLFQLGILLLFAIFGALGLAIIFLWGWFIFAIGDEPPQPWTVQIFRLLIVMAIDNLIYAPLLYCILWNRDLKKEARKRPFTA